MRLTFIQLGTYVADAARLGFTDEDQRDLEQALLARPDAGRVIKGTGGLRKLRHARRRSSGGKSGGTRVCYAHFPAYAHVYFVVAFGKNEQADLTERQRRAARDLIREVETYLQETYHAS
jgi:hypothetical protein